ncbi:MAG: hypothetical protein LBD75_00995 [Candidatus Peribacteria bacterium]|jgi:2,3-bisphosphoglycerate-independent phosphoglycerate mutase|nr:hypothetical protein [Candidatus Peribacteria bacterium]
MKKVALIVFDGFGINDKTPQENAITLADAPLIHQLFTQKYAVIDASGVSVGLPQGQMGNSEVGHVTLGTGRISKQPFVEIDDVFAQGVFVKIPAFQEGIVNVREQHSHLHLVGLFST